MGCCSLQRFSVTNGLAADPYLQPAPLMGRVFLILAVEQGPVAAQAAGTNTTLHKMGALLVSAFVAGMAGAVYAHYQQSVGPHVFGVILTVTIITMAYVGGIGTTYGAIAGAFLLTIMTEGLRQFGEFRLLVYTLCLIAIIRFFPNGLLLPIFQRRGAS